MKNSKNNRNYCHMLKYKQKLTSREILHQHPGNSIRLAVVVVDMYFDSQQSSCVRKHLMSLRYVRDICLQTQRHDNTLRPGRNRQHFTYDIFKRIFLKECIWISLKISLKFVAYIGVKNIPALVQIKAGRRAGDKPLSEPMLVSLPTHICVSRPQWLNVKHAFPWLRWISEQ